MKTHNIDRKVRCKFLYFIICLQFCFIGGLNAQVQPSLSRTGSSYEILPFMNGAVSRNFIPASPNAAGLGTYGHIPVGNFTGTPNIDIPIYQIEYKDLTVPISISYHTNLIKPNDFPGALGLGWSLNCGGVITRVVNCGTDLEYEPSQDVDFNILKDPRGEQKWSDTEYLVENLKNKTKLDHQSDPDKFYFNFNGHTGSFYLDHTGTFSIQSSANEIFKIEVLHGDIEGSVVALPQTVTFIGYVGLKYSNQIRLGHIIKGFKLTDSQGIIYTFGASLSAMELTRNGLTGSEIVFPNELGRYVKPTAWYLASIESPNGYSINFTYKQETYITKYRFTDYGMLFNESNGNGILLMPSLHFNNSLKAHLINGCILEKISFPTGHIEFKHSVAYNQLGYDEVSPFYYYSKVVDLFNYHSHVFEGGKDCLLDGYGFRPEDLGQYCKKDEDYDHNYIQYLLINDPEKAYEYLDSCYLTDPHIEFFYTSFHRYPDVCNANTKKIFKSRPTKTNTRWPEFNYANESSMDEVRNRFFPHKFDAFIVYNGENEEIKHIKFDYTTSQSERLKLTSLAFYNGDGTAKMYRYNFVYNPEKLPYYLTSTADHYGFYNGNGYPSPEQINTCFMSSYSKEAADIFNQYKLPVPALYNPKREMLEKIIYPTGGYSSIEYESHAYGGECKTYPFRVETINGIVKTGGVRVKGIKNFEQGGTLLNEKKYHYIKDYINGGNKSSGILVYTPEYIEDYEDVEMKGYAHITSSVQFSRFRRISSNPVFPLSTAGSHITYSEVTVEEPGNGYTVYKYKNYDNGYQDKEPFNQVSDLVMVSGKEMQFSKKDLPVSMELERGQLLSQEVFDVDKNKKIKTTYLYNDDPHRFDENVRFMRLYQNGVDFVNKVRSHRFSTGVHYTYYPYLKEQIDTTYLSSGNLIERKLFTHDLKYRLNKSMQIFSSHGDSISTTTIFPHELVSTKTIYKDMKDKYMLNYPIEVEKKYSGSDKLISKTINEYSTGLSPSSPQSILIYQNKIQYPNETSQRIESTITKYGLYNNPESIVDKLGNTTYIIWGYNGLYPIAEIKNTSYSDVTAAIKNVFGVASIDALSVLPVPDESKLKNGSLQKALPNAFVTTYTYKQLVGMTSMTDPACKTTTYEYETSGRLHKIKDPTGDTVEEYRYNHVNK